MIRLFRHCGTCGRWLVWRPTCRVCVRTRAFSEQVHDAMDRWRRGDPPPLREEDLR